MNNNPALNISLCLVASADTGPSVCVHTSVPFMLQHLEENKMYDGCSISSWPNMEGITLALIFYYYI